MSGIFGSGLPKGSASRKAVGGILGGELLKDDDDSGDETRRKKRRNRSVLTRNWQQPPSVLNPQGLNL